MRRVMDASLERARIDGFGLSVGATAAVWPADGARPGSRHEGGRARPEDSARPRSQAEELQQTIAALAAELRALKDPSGGGRRPLPAAASQDEVPRRTVNRSCGRILAGTSAATSWASRPSSSSRSRFQALAARRHVGRGCADQLRADADGDPLGGPAVAEGRPRIRDPVPSGARRQRVRDGQRCLRRVLPVRTRVRSRRPVRQAVRVRHPAVERRARVAGTRHLRRLFLPGPAGPRRHAACRVWRTAFSCSSGPSTATGSSPTATAG